MASIQGIYIALFGRPADPLGLEYFNGVTGNGADLAAISDLAATAEYQDRFEGMSNVQIINSIYQSLFGRDADLAGLTFFAQALQDGTFNINNIAIAILDGAQGDDLATVNNKIEAANLFTASLDTGAEVVAYQGSEAAAAGRDFLAGITADEATVPTQAQVDAAIEDIVDDGQAGGAGETFTLTNSSNAITGGVDEVTGTAGQDTFRAVLANSLGSTDILDGGAGADVLNIAAAGISTTAGDNAPVISGVERINNSDAVTTLNLANVTGVEQVWTDGAAGTYTNASTGTTFGATAASTVNIDYAGSLTGRTNASLAVALATGTVAFDFGADATAIESVSVVAASGNATATIDADVTVLDTIEVSGAGRLTVTSAETTVTTFDASENTGGVSWTSGNLAAAATVSGGAGNDTLNLGAVAGTSVVLTIDAGAGNDIVTAGAGNDVINGGEGNDIITGNAGNDTINGGAGNDVITGGVGADAITGGAGNDQINYVSGDSSYAAGTNNTMDTIADFNASGDDTISLDLATDPTFAGAVTVINVENAIAGLSASATLLDALNAVEGVLAADELAWFEFGGNTYVYADENGAGAGYVAGDLVIQLTGSVELQQSDFIIA